MLSEGFNADLELNLKPIQLPFQDEDSWLGSQFPDNYKIETDKLLYTAYLTSFDASQQQSGLLIDEWTEVIPQQAETTGMACHYDQPNNEPPQTFLLVTSPEFSETSQWQWKNLADSLHETLDIAQIRGIEPDLIENSHYAQFLPATLSLAAVTSTSIGLNFALNNGLDLIKNEE